MTNTPSALVQIRWSVGFPTLEARLYRAAPRQIASLMLGRSAFPARLFFGYSRGTAGTLWNAIEFTREIFGGWGLGNPRINPMPVSGRGLKTSVNCGCTKVILEGL